MAAGQGRLAISNTYYLGNLARSENAKTVLIPADIQDTLRGILGRSFRNRGSAVLAGLGVTGLVQSSTATCLIVASFVGKGLVPTGAALAVMLGADVGSAMMAVVFSLDLSWLSPLLIFAGVVMFTTRQNSGVGRVGRVQRRGLPVLEADQMRLAAQVGIGPVAAGLLALDAGEGGVLHVVAVERVERPIAERGFVVVRRLQLGYNPPRASASSNRRLTHGV